MNIKAKIHRKSMVEDVTILDILYFRELPQPVVVYAHPNGRLDQDVLFIDKQPTFEVVAPVDGQRASYYGEEVTIITFLPTVFDPYPWADRQYAPCRLPAIVVNSRGFLDMCWLFHLSIA